ncbi:MAG: hypothetical protein IPL49_05730 [Saprospirales bacterium]|nr:hypothetical protein [Saprospirales bacterium]
MVQAAHLHRMASLFELDAVKPRFIGGCTGPALGVEKGSANNGCAVILIGYEAAYCRYSFPGPLFSFPMVMDFSTNSLLVSRKASVGF